MELKDIKGFGAKRIEALNEKGIFTCLDLLKLEPTKYLDYSNIVGVETTLTLPQTIKAQVISVAKTAFFKGKSATTVKMLDLNNLKSFTAVWYNQPFMKSNLKMDEVFYLIGSFNKNRQLVVSNITPSTKIGDAVVPVYKKSSGLTSGVIRSSIKQILESGEQFSVVSKKVEEDNDLLPLNSAFHELHFPSSVDELEKAKDRINFEDMLLLASLEKLVKQSSKEKEREYNNVIDEFKSNIPFTLTQDQEKALAEIIDDMQSKKVMNRLLLGDVGSGKTLVAFGASFVAIRSGFQAVLMCPTEILAKQHLKSAKTFLSCLGVRVELLHSGLTSSQKKEIYQGLEMGEIDLLISTHSALSDKVEFKNLALVITDEQHRFGVTERAKIASKGENPDVLVMSATPIPRSLSLVLFGGLDVSEIKTRPSGESKIKTNLVSGSKEADMWKFILNEINENQGKCFVVVPRIADSEDSNLMSIKNVLNRLCEFNIPSKLIGSVHGKTKKEEADEIIKNFTNGQIKILVATTIVEVGIDVKSANLMVIYNADRFGLATLHQLRGRVGRDGREGYCFALLGSTNEASISRLDVFKKYNSGIKLAEEDLKLRGAGTMYGTNQHGTSEIFLNLNFSIESYSKASEIINTLSENELQKITSLAETQFGDIYKKVVLN